jgi:N-acyl-L-homoserine lactone synthetase
MLKLLSGRRAELSPETMYQLARFRHKVFIQELGWSLPTTGGLEFDEFDHADTLYVIAFDRNGEIAGCGRLLPTDEPYLLGVAFPDLMGGAPLPRARDVWELSRFAVNMPRDELLSARESWQNTCRMMAEIVRVAQAHGATRLIAFSVLGNERLLKRMGINVHRAAPPQLIEGKPTLPFWIEIDQQTRAVLNIESQPDWLSNSSKNLPAVHARGLVACIE